MLVTGLSPASDIEQLLELGAHGPRQLNVLPIKVDPAAHLAAGAPMTVHAFETASLRSVCCALALYSSAPVLAQRPVLEALR